MNFRTRFRRLRFRVKRNFANGFLSVPDKEIAIYRTGDSFGDKLAARENAHTSLSLSLSLSRMPSSGRNRHDGFKRITQSARIRGSPPHLEFTRACARKHRRYFDDSDEMTRKESSLPYAA